MKNKKILITVLIFILCIAGIAVAAFWPDAAKNAKSPIEHYRTRVITPVVAAGAEQDFSADEGQAHEESYNLKAALEDGEFVISLLDLDFIEDQIVVYRSLTDRENPISITYIAYDEKIKEYRRLWNAPVAATMPATVTLFTMDLIGDRSVCIIVTGMNTSGEHTMTIYRKKPQEDKNTVFDKIADIQMDGSIAIEEADRQMAYRQGIAGGRSFSINAYRRDGESANMLDRIEIVYSYNPEREIYEQSKLTRVPGSQIEQRRVREILSGDKNVFENFINDLWYQVSPDGTLDKDQYLYFDPAKREIIFYGDSTQQIFSWQSSSPTRYGLYISCQNISVTTLRRTLNIELDSLDNIRIRGFEDVRLKISINSPWDGLYRRAGSAAWVLSNGNTSPFINAVYDSLSGRIVFHPDGEYEFTSGDRPAKGRYVFFQAGGSDLLEIRPEANSPAPLGQQLSGIENDGNRFVYHVTVQGGAGRDGLPPGNISLLRVRLGVTGIQDLHEGQITLTRVNLQ